MGPAHHQIILFTTKLFKQHFVYLANNQYSVFNIDNWDDWPIPIDFVTKDTNVMVSNDGQMNLLLDRLLVQVEHLLYDLLALVGQIHLAEVTFQSDEVAFGTVANLRELEKIFG